VSHGRAEACEGESTMALDHLKRPKPAPRPPAAGHRPTPAASRVAVQAAPKPPKPAVVYQCGHKVAVVHLESIDCPGCRAG
jgi:hypothetical protein